MSKSPGARLRGGGARPRRGRLRVLGDMLLAVVVLGLLALVVARLDEGAAIRIEGGASVVDGDTLVIAGERVRLRGLDAPELDQTCRRDGSDYPCGREARKALAELIGARPVECVGRRRDRYGRLLADCRAERTELARAQVVAGWAVAYGDYDKEEAMARDRGQGLWAGEFDRPKDWREMRGGAAEDEHVRGWAVVEWLRAILGFP